MARSRNRDDDYEDDFDDRRSRSSSSGSKTVLIVVGIIVGVFLLMGLTCAGLIAYSVNQVKNAVESIAGPTLASETFFMNLKTNRIEEAYASTSANYKSTVSRKQFDDLIKNNPILTAHTNHTLSNPSFPSKNNGKATATMGYRLDTGIPGNTDAFDDADPDEDDPKPKTKTKPTVKDPKAVDEKTKDSNKLKAKTVNLTLVEENGKWVIDKLDIP